MSAKPTLTVEYLEPEVEAEGLPEEFSPSRLRRSLLTLGVIVLAVVGVIVLVPGLASLRERFAGAQPGWAAPAVWRWERGSFAGAVCRAGSSPGARSRSSC